MIAALALYAAVLAPVAPVAPSHDQVLLARFRAGEADAFAAIYRAHAVSVYRRLSRVLGPIAEREDLVQDVFLALHRALPSFRGEAALSTLIHRIALNRAYDHLRRQARRPAVLVEGWFLDQLEATAATPELRTSEREELARVFACLARLKPRKRIAFLLRVVEGLEIAEIAELVDATPDAVAKRIQHAQRELAAQLARRTDR